MGKVWKQYEQTVRLCVSPYTPNGDSSENVGDIFYLEKDHNRLSELCHTPLVFLSPPSL